MLTVITIVLVFIIVVLALAVASIVASYNDLYKKFEKDVNSVAKTGRDLKGSQKILDEEKLILKQRLDMVVGRESGEFQKVLEDVKKDAQKIFLEIASSSKTQIMADLENFRKQLEARQVQDTNIVRLELAKYKTEKEKELDRKAKSILQEVAMEVLGISIDPDKHEELILKALNKAKQEKFF